MMAIVATAIIIALALWMFVPLFRRSPTPKRRNEAFAAGDTQTGTQYSAAGGEIIGFSHQAGEAGGGDCGGGDGGGSSD